MPAVQAQHYAPAHQPFYLKTLLHSHTGLTKLTDVSPLKKNKIKIGLWSYVTIYLFPNLSMAILFLSYILYSYKGQVYTQHMNNIVYHYTIE